MDWKEGTKRLEVDASLMVSTDSQMKMIALSQAISLKRIADMMAKWDAEHDVPVGDPRATYDDQNDG